MVHRRMNIDLSKIITELQILTALGSPATAVVGVEFFRGSGVFITGIFDGELKEKIVNRRAGRVTVKCDAQKTVCAEYAINPDGSVKLSNITQKA